MGHSAESKAANKVIAAKEFFCRSCGRYQVNALKTFIGKRMLCKYCHEKIALRNLELKAGTKSATH